ncbi:GTP pyrophosphokinase [Cellulomonas septica]|uniref:GTP pyrophosphokinase family protein n=1 Tax=Cellulomonas septica TaxID=285080 RepID=A0ABX1JUW2_9CELL|nr:GTP pyrophosphokinase family protein [Cellulomonas septica]NKY38099.1 GTP pyrophosphokinase family protein [Cellulomonas septica]
MPSTSAAPAPALDAGVDLERLVQDYRAALAQVVLQLDDVRQGLRARLGHDPVEHVSWRLKAPESIVAKARRKRIPLCDDGLRREMLDLAGLRLVCAFASDLRDVRDAVVALPGVVLLDERDYVAHPKPSGYRALHLIVRVPVRRADGSDGAVVEIQLRSVAMDLWACLEHRLAYRHHGARPVRVAATLRRAVALTRALDGSMDRVRDHCRTGGDQARTRLAA